MKRIPPSVWLAIASLAAAIGCVGWLTAEAGGEGLGWGQVGFAAALAALVFGGILARLRLAWLWGHALSLFLALLQAVALGGALWRGGLRLGTGLALGGSVVAFGAAAAALRRRAALVWFDLVCPRCLTPCRMGADFLFRRAHCRNCGHVW